MGLFNGPVLAKAEGSTMPSFGGRAGKIGEILSLLELGRQVYNFGRGYYHRKFSYSVSVSEKDSLYQEVHNWLLAVLPNEKHRGLSVSSGRRTTNHYDDDMVAPEGGGNNRTQKVDPLTIQFDDGDVRTVFIDGHKVIVGLQQPDTSGKADKFIEMYQQYSTISFTVFSPAAQLAVIRQLEVLNQKRAVTRKAELKMVNQWGSWRTRSDLPARSMASVSLPQEQKDRVLNDVKGFLEAEEQYNRLAIPWHRGYMFHGPPGTGKTSLVKAIANEFNLDLWYVSLADLKAESSLLGLLADVGPRSLLLLEDIDTIKITHDRDASEAGTISMGSLLNTLDGVATPHGLITVMTTNRFEVLDPALTRAGRMDLIEKLDWPKLSTIKEMHKHFYGVNGHFLGIREDDFINHQISTSEVAEIMKRNLENPKQAEKDIRRLANG